MTNREQAAKPAAESPRSPQRGQGELDRDCPRLCGCVRVARCTAGARTAVAGAGPVTAEIVLIGEGPGFHEDRQGLPFCRRVGQFPRRAAGRGRAKTRGRVLSPTW
jgi:uracil-DNA glycosylase